MRQNNQPVGDVLRALVKELRMEGKLAQSELRTLWERELGGLINRHTTEVSFRNGTLYVNVNSAPLRQELLYNKAQLIAQLNAKLREPVVKELVVR